MNNVATLGAKNNRVNDMESSKNENKNQRKILDDCGLGRHRAKE
ncbi:MAG TPA: hypothetical protein VFM18_13165 [Methanosarcina sp.]|nr:hypothetical protein [Methanosarcina sp.]